MNYLPIEWRGNKVRILDQTRLPQAEVYLEFSDYQGIASAIKELKIRGAPAIGVAGAYAVALGALEIEARSKDQFLEKLHSIVRTIAATRPTAKNLFRAIDRMRQLAQAGRAIEHIKEALIQEAIKIHDEEAESRRCLCGKQT